MIREGRLRDDEILTCRIMDRPLRPLFPDGFRRDTQIIATVLSADKINPTDVLALDRIHWTMIRIDGRGCKMTVLDNNVA